MTKHIAAYLRVSSKSQDTKSQEPELKKWASNQDTLVKVYSDKFTGKTMDRPGWNKLQAAIQRNEVSSIVVWRLDRLGRTASGLTKLFDELRHKKLNLISLKDGLDLSTAAGRLMANVLASVSQYDNEVRTERVIAGQSVARSKGKKWGGSNKGRRLFITSEQVATVHKLHSDGLTVAAIARSVSVSRVTVYRLLNEGVVSNCPQ